MNYLKSAVFLLLLGTYVALLFTEEKEDPSGVVISYVKMVNSFNFNEANQFRKIPFELKVIPPEFEPVKALCQNLEVKVTSFTLDYNFGVAETEEDLCEPNEILALFEYQELNSKLTDDQIMDKAGRQARLESYLEGFKEHRDVYISKIQMRYYLEKIDGKWLIIDE